jgi:hypothetical protein
MFDNIDPAVKQYLTFSLVLAVILSVIINFGLVDLVKGTFAYGFPVNLSEAVGFANFIGRIINTLVFSFFLTVPVYFGLKWLRERGN